MEDNLTPEAGGLPAVQGKPVAAPKGYGYSLPTPSGGVPVPSSILDELERIYQRRVAAQNPFQEWMKDISAWGEKGGPAARQQEKSMREQELFRMRADIASQRAAQQQLALRAKKLQGIVGPGGAQGQIPPHVAIAIKEKLDVDDVAGAEKVLDDYRKGVTTEETKFITNPSTYARNIEIVLPDGRIEIVDALTARRMAESGQGIIVPPTATSAPTSKPAAVPTTPTTTSTSAAIPTAPAPAAPKVSTIEPGPVAPVIKPVSAEAQTLPFSFESLSQDQRNALEAGMESEGIRSRGVFNRPDMAERFNAYPEDVRRKLFSAADDIIATRGEGAIPVSGQISPVTTTPTSLTQVAQAPTAQLRPTLPEARAKAEAEKEERKGIAEKEAKQFESFLTATEAPVAIDRAQTAREIIDITKQKPQIVGILQNQGVASALATLLQSGVSISGGHSVGMKDLDEALFRARPGTKPEDIEARDRLRTLLEKTAFHLSTIIKGQGQVTEFERTLLQQVAGSIRSTPENIIKIQQGLLARAELDQKLGEMYNSRPSGMTYSQFKATDKYKNAVKAYEDQLRQIQKEKVVFPTPPAPGAPKSGTTPGGLKWRVVP